MRVTVRLFAMLRERAGSDRVELELPDGARVADALAAVEHLAGGLSLVMAVNREYAAEDQRLEAGDELALIPPVSGGATTAPHVALRDEPLALDALAARVAALHAAGLEVYVYFRHEDEPTAPAYAEQLMTLISAAAGARGK